MTTTTAINLCSAPIKYTTNKNGLFLRHCGRNLRSVCACVWMFDCESVRIEKEATNGPNFFNFIWNLNWKKEQLQTTTNFHFWRQNARACKNCELFCNFRKKTEFYKFIKFWVMSASMRVQCNMICVYNNLCNRNYFLFKEIFFVFEPHVSLLRYANSKYNTVHVCVCVFSFSLFSLIQLEIRMQNQASFSWSNLFFESF